MWPDKKVNRKTKANLEGYSFILPGTLLLLIFSFIPITVTIYLSFQKYNGLNPPQWVGFANYIKAFKDYAVTESFKNTLLFTVVTVPVQVAVSLSIAALLAARYKNKFGEFVRGALFIPVLCSATLVGSVFFYVFAATEDSIANTIVGLFGISKINWLGSTKTALWVIMFVSIWKGIGYFIVIFYAGIMDIPITLYEVSQIDGASRMDQFIYITIPNLKNVLYMVITISIIWSLQFFDITYAMTKGGPGYATSSLVYVVYSTGFNYFNMGYASAVAVLLAILIAIFTAIQRSVMKED